MRHGCILAGFFGKEEMEIGTKRGHHHTQRRYHTLTHTQVFVYKAAVEETNKEKKKKKVHTGVLHSTGQSQGKKKRSTNLKALILGWSKKEKKKRKMGG